MVYRKGGGDLGSFIRSHGGLQEGEGLRLSTRSHGGLQEGEGLRLSL